MRLKTFVLVASGFLYVGSGHVQSASPSETTKTLQAHVAFLSSDSLEGRLTGTQGEKLATQYVAEVFQRQGLEPAGDNGTFFQEFDFTPGVSFRKNGIGITGHVDVQQKKQRGRNVLARLKVGTTTSRMIIVGAHVDHLGRGETGGSRSRENEIKRIHNGADDNASGVASVLEASAKLSALKAQGKLHGNKDILFAIWSGEELGLLGSSHFINKFREKTRNQSLRPAIDAYINLDMVGRLRKNLVLQGVGSSTTWPALIERVNRQGALSLILQRDPYLPTDSTLFYLHGVPVLNFFTGAHDEYHTPRDKMDKVNFEGMKTISNFLAALILALEADPGLMDYQQVQKTGKHSRRGFKVYLGTIPDYASADVKGIKLSGVTKGSPADRAGLRQEDVIVELAGKKIHDIYDYSFVLSSLHANEPVSLVVRRGQTSVTLTIVAQSRE